MTRRVSSYARCERRAARLLSVLSVVGAAVGCDDGSADETRLQPTAASGGGGSGGSPTLTAGNGGNGGGPQEFDAGADATPDAAGPSDLCVPGSLATYCANSACPAFADARQSLRQQPPGFASPLLDIVQRSCVAADGSARVSVAANYSSWTRTFIYAAETQQLTGVVLTADVGPECDGSGVFRDMLAGFYGERAPDCEWQGRPPGCDAGDAGVSDTSDAGPDAGPQACVLTP